MRMKIVIAALASVLGVPCLVHAEITHLSCEQTGPSEYKLSYTLTGDSHRVAIFAGTDARAPKGDAILTTSESTVTVHAGEPGEREYFFLRPDHGGEREVSIRHLALQGTPNFRDLGGYETADGRFVRWGLLYRSGVLSNLTPADFAYLSHLGIRVVCDFRTAQENATAKEIWIPGAQVTQVSLPIGGDGGKGSGASVSALLANNPSAADLKERMTKVYGQFAFTNAPEYAKVFKQLEEDHLPLLYHCTAGKDRTGVFSALLLTILGVPRSTVLEDYALTNKYLMSGMTAEESKKMLAGNPGLARLTPEQRNVLMAADPEVSEEHLRADRCEVRLLRQLPQDRARGLGRRRSVAQVAAAAAVEHPGRPGWRKKRRLAADVTWGWVEAAPYDFSRSYREIEADAFIPDWLRITYPDRTMPKLSIRDLNLKDKRVFIRVDFNVPLSPEGAILDDTRIRETLPTIEYALRHKARVILASHLGRPKGKPVASMSLRPIVDHLRNLLDHVLGEDENVAFSPDCVGEIASELAANLEPGQTLLLENLRFHAEEEKNDPAFAKELASLCDIYVNDAFGSAHRAHASTEGITHFVGQSAAGLLMEKELTYMGKALTEPDKPFVAIIGGAKVSDKIGVIDNLLEKADAIIIGGGMAYTFLNAQGQSTGKSLVEFDKLDIAKAALGKAKSKGVRFLLPTDHVLADKFAPDAKTTIFSGDGPFPAGLMALDIGPASIKLFSDEIANARTVIWNGPMGVFEMPVFAHGTNAIASAVAHNEEATTIVGGGDSVSAIFKSGFAPKITHISTGGGASLEFLEGKILPGVAALTDK